MLKTLTNEELDKTEAPGANHDSEPQTKPRTKVCYESRLTTILASEYKEKNKTKQAYEMDNCLSK